MLNPYLKNIELSKNEYKTYARHFILDEIGIQGQKRLKQAKILFIGAGGLASPAIIYLASSGIGCIGIIDNDIISYSNLHRQILYNCTNVNNMKVKIAKQKIHTINPLCKVIIYPYTLEINNSLNIIHEYDIIIDTSDNFKTRYIIDEMCFFLHKIHIYGAISKFEGQLSVFNYQSGPTYADLYPKSLYLQNNTCNNTGVLSVLPGIIGILQATEAIKIILGIGNILSGCILIYNALDMSFKKIQIHQKQHIFKSKNYSNHHALNILNTDTLKKINLQHPIVIIDVRQNIEFQKWHLKQSINIPLKNMNYKSTIQFIIHNLLNRAIIIYCSQNSRSLIASQLLNKYDICHYILYNT